MKKYMGKVRMSSVSKELLKNVLNKFTNNGHSNDSSYLIVKYFIGLTKSKINGYQQEIKHLKSTSSVHDCKKK